MAEIKDVKIWRKGSEARIYIHTMDGREACYYKTGNTWHEKESWESQLTDDEIKRAKNLAIYDKQWHNIPEWEMAARIAIVDGAKVTVKGISLLAPERNVMRNRHPDHCRACGKFLQAGEGELVHYTDEEDIDYLGGGKSWVVYCIDTQGCQARVNATKAEVQRAGERRESLDDEAAQLSKRVAAQTGMEESTDWSWDDYRFSVGEIIAESEHHVAREYKEGDTTISFVIKKREER